MTTPDQMVNGGLGLEGRDLQRCVFPMHVTTDMLRWQIKNRLEGNKRFPVVLMLEPLYTCNLACLGCTPERHTGDIRNRLSLEQCVQALDDVRRARPFDLWGRTDNLPGAGPARPGGHRA